MDNKNAAREAYAEDFILKFPKQYRQLVGERGIKLSVGQKQRVAIARALVHRPSIIVADEPTGNLDPINTWDIIRLLTKINELGTTVLVATHNAALVDKLGKRKLTLEKGKLIADEKTDGKK